jgi:hypothetical protein
MQSRDFRSDSKPTSHTDLSPSGLVDRLELDSRIILNQIIEQRELMSIA